MEDAAEVDEDNETLAEAPSGDTVGDEDPTMFVDGGTTVLAGALARVADEATVGKADAPVGETVEPGVAVTVTIVVTVTVGSPLVPMAVWIGAGSANVLVDVVETKEDAVEAEVTEVEEEVVGGNVSVVDEEAAGVEVLAGTVTKLILIWRLLRDAVGVADVGTVDADGVAVVPSSQSASPVTVVFVPVFEGSSSQS